MAMLTASLCFAIMVAGFVAAGFGLTTMAATRRLDQRMARLIAPVERPASRPFRMANILVARGRDRTEIEEKLQQAGFQGEYAMEQFLWIRLGATLGAVLLAAALFHAVSGDALKRPFLLFAIGGGTYIAAKRALDLFAAARLRAITGEFPFLLDLMLMMLESGISLDQCFRAVAAGESNAAPHLTRSIEALVADLNRGMSYETALDRWAQRLGVPGGRELGTLFQQGLFQGIELSPALREFVREFTERRVASAREAMGRIGVQMVVVMMLFFMPALFIVIGGPPLTSLLDTLGSLKRR